MMSQVVSLLDLAPLETGLGFGALNVHQCCCDFTVTLKPGQPQCSKKPVTHGKKSRLSGSYCAAAGIQVCRPPVDTGSFSGKSVLTNDCDLLEHI